MYIVVAIFYVLFVLLMLISKYYLGIDKGIFDLLFVPLVIGVIFILVPLIAVFFEPILLIPLLIIVLAIIWIVSKDRFPNHRAYAGAGLTAMWIVFGYVCFMGMAFMDKTGSMGFWD